MNIPKQSDVGYAEEILSTEWVKYDQWVGLVVIQ